MADPRAVAVRTQVSWIVDAGFAKLAQDAQFHALVRRCLFGFALPAQDHEVVGIGYDARAEALLKLEHLPSQHEPAHLKIRQRW
jgi:hypothetical protein